MIPMIVEEYLRRWYSGFEYCVHAPAQTAQQRAIAEHVSGYRVAKMVVLKVDGDMVIAVIAATDRVNVHPLEEATGARVALASEAEFADRFLPCEPGTAPPMALFGLPIYVDDKLMREPSIVIPAGTREDAAVVRTAEWLWCERVQPLINLGSRTRVARRSFAGAMAGPGATREARRRATVPPQRAPCHAPAS
jgi:Ala-tRNA(Pro) deacylase